VDEARQHVTVSGGGFAASGGNPNLASDNIDIASNLIPNAAYAQSMADQYADFYSRGRGEMDAVVVDEPGLSFKPMNRVVVDGRRFYVYESDHRPAEDEWSLKLLEDLEDQPLP